MTYEREYDVVVCGAGPAGLGAAISAARQGAKTLLVERLGFVGGMHTGAGVTNWCDTPGGPIFDEFVERLTTLHGLRWVEDPVHYVDPGRAAITPEFFRMVAMQILNEAGVDLLLLTFFEKAVTIDGRVTAVECINKAGHIRVNAGVVIDCTADADVAASAGCDIALGDPEDGRLQHCNFRATFENIDYEQYAKDKPSNEQLLEWIRLAQDEGRITPPDGAFQPEAETFPFNQRYKVLQLTSWDMEGVDPLDPWQVSRALQQCNIATLQVLEFCRRHLPGYDQCSIRNIASVLGIRESRRIVGQYTLTAEDVTEAHKFDDGIVSACFFMDLHDSPPGDTMPFSTETIWARRPTRGEHFEIPFRCLVPIRIQGLLVAGRCISAERMAHGAARVMPTCMFLGTAAGTAAALAVRSSRRPDEIESREIRALIGMPVGDPL